jgi:hypothetical protein
VRRILITANKSVRDWSELLAGDEVLAAAILDRLLHRAHVLNIEGRSYSLRDLKNALRRGGAGRGSAAGHGTTSGAGGTEPSEEGGRRVLSWRRPPSITIFASWSG